MNKLPDPGKNLAREEAKAERIKEWKRPATKSDRDKAKSERLQDWSEKYGDIDSAKRRIAR